MTTTTAIDDLRRLAVSDAFAQVDAALQRTVRLLLASHFGTVAERIDHWAPDFYERRAGELLTRCQEFLT